MKKVFLVGLAVLAVSTSGAWAQKATKQKAGATAATTTTPSLFQVSAADKELYRRNQRDSGIKAK